jgi:hypothetical protein
MAQVTGGKVVYSRKVQAAQYEPKDATVELSFSIDEGERDYESFLDQVANAAVVKVHTMIGLAMPTLKASMEYQFTPNDGALPAEGTTDPSERTKDDLAAEKIAEVTDPASIEPKPERKKPGRPPKVNKDPDPAALSPSGDTAEAPAQADATVRSTEAKPDPSVITAESPSGEGGGSGTITADDPAQSGARSDTTDPASLGGAEEWEATPPPLTDAEVLSAITRTNARVMQPEAIKQLVWKFAGNPPKTFRDIPLEVRPTFVAELEAL